MAMAIADQVRAVRAEIQAACDRVGRDSQSVHLIAVTKSQGPEVLQPLQAAGLLQFGENRIDHLEIMARAAPEGACFHHIGRIQSRHIDSIVQHAGVVHGLNDASHVQRFDRLAAAQQRRLRIFCQVNTSGEETKSGVEPAQLSALVDLVRSCSHLDCVGLMTMAPELGVYASEDQVRTCFAGLRELAQQQGLPRLSMGMSGDFHIAVEEGATDIRIGTRLFQ